MMNPIVPRSTQYQGTARRFGVTLAAPCIVFLAACGIFQVRVQKQEGTLASVAPRAENPILQYLQTIAPGNTPEIFNVGEINLAGKNSHRVAFSSDGRQLFFSRYPDGISYVMTFRDGQWSEPEAAFFSGREVAFSPDGGRLFFYRGLNIFYSEWDGTGWGDPVDAGSAVNAGAQQYYPSVTNDGTLFFSRIGEWSQARLMTSEWKNGKYSQPVDLGWPVNNGGALHAYVAPDKSYLIFNSPRAGSHTQLDLWISYGKSDGSWTDPKNLGESINSGADAIICPTISPDGKYLFFTKLIIGADNASTGTVYWVGTDFIGALR